MKNLLLTFVGVLLVAVSTVSLSKTLNSNAATAKRSPQPRVAVLPATPAKLKQGWRLGAPVRHENLTIFPVLSDESGGTDEFITLDAGLRSGKVKVTEMKAQSRQSHPRRAQNSNTAQRQRANAQRNIVQEQVSYEGDGAEVNKVLVTNNSGKTLVLIAGEFILGGKQDRIVGQDCIVASTNTPMPIDVFCVEHGRWEATSTRRSRTGLHSGRGNVETTASGMAFAPAVEVMAAPKVRANAQANKSQSDVWSEVADKVAKNSVSTETGTLNSVYDNKQVSTRLNNYQNAIKVKFADKNIIGAVVAVNGKILSADVFASPQLFQAYQAKLLKSYALEAISADKTKSQEVKATDAEAFLSNSNGEESAVEKSGVYRLAEKQSDADASFELVHTKKEARLIHFNRVIKK